MNPFAFTSATVASLPLFSARQYAALRLLREAAEAAEKQGQDIWQFAVEIGRLHVLGLSPAEIASLLDHGYIEHALECTPADASVRAFRRVSSLTLSSRTCFVLATGRRATASSAAVRRSQTPYWDSLARQLWWRDCLIKQFRVPAVNQECVLAALEEEGWPPRIDDPLPQTSKVDPKVRLHDTIKALNRHQRHKCICFQGDGRGQAIRWFICSDVLTGPLCPDVVAVARAQARMG